MALNASVLFNQDIPVSTAVKKKLHTFIFHWNLPLMPSWVSYQNLTNVMSVLLSIYWFCHLLLTDFIFHVCKVIRIKKVDLEVCLFIYTKIWELTFFLSAGSIAERRSISWGYFTVLSFQTSHYALVLAPSLYNGSHFYMQTTHLVGQEPIVGVAKNIFSL